MKFSSHKFTTMIQEGKSLQLQPQEKEVMRKALHAYVDYEPVPRASLWTWLASPLPMALALLLLVGGGVSYASAHALPGDVLYTVKVQVNERVEGWLYLSPEAKLAWETQLINRRLEEAETLVVEGRLDAQTQAHIKVSLEARVDQITDQVAKSESEVAANVSAQLESSLQVHEQVLSRLSVDATQQGTVNDIRALVSVKVQQAAQVRKASEEKDQAQEALKVRAQKMIERTQKASQETETLLANAQTLDAQIIKKAQIQLGSVNSLLLQAKVEMEAGRYDNVKGLCNEALRLAQETKVFIEVNQHLALRATQANDQKSVDEAIIKEEIHSNTSSTIQINLGL